MTAFVGECRREWKRLGVPDLIAEEMAAELESDLAEAQADGVSEVEILGESDPRRFAASWASERGLVSERSEIQRRKVWPWVVAVVAVLFVGVPLAGVLLATISFGSGNSSPQRGQPVTVLSPTGRPRRIAVPNLVGERRRAAVANARASGLRPAVRVTSLPGPSGVVVRQRPRPGPRVDRGSAIRLVVGR
jgi:PASTA domain